MLKLTQLHGFNAVYREVDLAFTDSANAEDFDFQVSISTFEDMDIGAAASDRYVYTVYGFKNDGAVTSVTIGGISATEAITGFNSNVTGELIRIAIWYALVPTGTTATCLFNHSGGTVEKAALAVYTARGVGNPALATDNDNQTIQTANGGPFAVPPGGAVIAGSVWGDNSSTLWSGLTEDSDMVPSAGDGQVSSASEDFRVGDSSLSISATFGLFENGALAAVVIAPRTA